MIRTQIQLSEESYKTAKAMAAAKEMTLTEIIRRALDDYIARNPGALSGKKEWTFPQGRNLGIPNDIDWSRVKDELYDRNPFISIEDQ